MVDRRRMQLILALFPFQLKLEQSMARGVAEISEQKVGPSYHCSIIVFSSRSLRSLFRPLFFPSASKVPGVFYGHDDDGAAIKVLIMLESTVVAREMRVRGMELENTIFDLEIEGLSTCRVVPRTVQIHPSKQV